MIKIRRSEFKDWQIIQKLNFGMYAHQAQFDPFLDMDEPFSQESIKDYQDDVNNPKKCALIAEIDGQPVGYLVGKETKINYRKLVLGEINHMAVDEKFRGQGIGSKLIDEFRTWCRENKIDKIKAVAYYANTETVKFYEKHGLKPEGIILEGSV